MPVDPNWLPSAIAQSSAALVAIIGGFLVSRLISMSSEKRALQQRRQELVARRRLAKEQWRSAHEERLDESQDWFLDHHLDRLVSSQGGVEVEELLEEFVPLGSSDDEMRPYAERLKAIVQDAYEAVTHAFNGPEFPSGDVDHLQSRGVNVPPEHETIFSRVGSAIAAQRRGPRPGTTPFPAVISTSVDTDVRRQEARIERERSLYAELQAFDAEVGLVDEQLMRLSAPEGVGAAVAVLTYLSVVGIVVPLAMMASRPVVAGLVARRLQLGLFVSGLIVLLAYIAWMVRRVLAETEE